MLGAVEELGAPAEVLGSVDVLGAEYVGVTFAGLESSELKCFLCKILQLNPP